MVRFTVLSENTPGEGLQGEHGLSLHIRTRKNSILFDMGAGPLFAQNARALGVDLAGVDMAVLSHGHYDHGGGLSQFLEINPRAPVYLRREALRPHFARRAEGRYEDIGLDPGLEGHPRLVFVGDRYSPADGLLLFSGVEARHPLPSGNATLFVKTQEGFVPDDFVHEQNLYLEASRVLVSGCSHRGILNILDRLRELTGQSPACVIGGLHLSNPALGTGEDPAVVARVAERFLPEGILLYTGHCTGEASAESLGRMLGEGARLLHTGLAFELP